MTTNPWIPIALSASIEPGTSAGTRVLGEERVVWRDEAGAPHVWEDRCPHRGMRMSFGFVRGDHIACLYHGWRYDTAGQCRHIPAHPDLDVPKTIKVPTFAVAEKGGIVWMATEGADLAELPAVPEHAHPVRSLFLDQPIALVRAAVVDTPPQGWRAEPLANDVVTLRGNDATAILALQTRDTSKTGLHITVAGEASTAIRRELAIWATALRTRLETEMTKAA